MLFVKFSLCIHFFLCAKVPHFSPYLAAFSVTKFYIVSFLLFDFFFYFRNVFNIFYVFYHIFSLVSPFLVIADTFSFVSFNLFCFCILNIFLCNIFF